MKNVPNLQEFIKDLIKNIDDISQSDLQGIIQARCLNTNENEETILIIIENYLKNKK
jgi:hypothetical protein